MPYITSLLKNINDYAKTTRAFALRSLADENLYQQLIDASKEILNPDVAYTIQILAEMYRKALEIKGGFNVVYRTIQGIIEDLDPEEPEQLAVENLLNKIGLSIRAKAANPDNPNDLRILHQTAADVKRNLANEEIDRFDEDPENEEQEMSAYETALTGYQEQEEKKEEGFGGEEKAKETFDFTGGINPEDAKKGKGRGYSFGQARSYKEWDQVYRNEKAKYQEDLNGPDVMLPTAVQSARRLTAVRSNLKDLIKVLTNLEGLTKRAISIELKLLTETEVPHPQEQAELDKIKTNLQILEARRNILKASVRKFYQTAELQMFQNQLGQTADPHQKQLLEQRIALQELRLNPVKGKGQELKQRRILIDALTNGALSQETLDKQLSAIEQAKQFTAKITEMYRQIALNVGEKKRTILEQGKALPTKEERTMGKGTSVHAPIINQETGERMHLGKGRIHEYDFNVDSLDQVITLLGQSINTERTVVKQKLTDKMKKAKVDPNLLKPFIDDVANAANKTKLRDNKEFDPNKPITFTTDNSSKLGLYAAVKKLREKMIEFKNFQPETTQAVMSIRSSKFLKSFLDKTKLIRKWMDKEGIKTEDQVGFIRNTINEGKGLIAYYKRNPNIEGPNTQGHRLPILTKNKPRPYEKVLDEHKELQTGVSTYYRPVIVIVEKIVQQLQGMLQ